jgi:hypothetical protein
VSTHIGASRSAPSWSPSATSASRRDGSTARSVGSFAARSSQKGPRTVTGTGPAFVPSTIRERPPATTNAVPSEGWPAKGISYDGVKMRTRTSVSSRSGASTKVVSERFV